MAVPSSARGGAGQGYAFEKWLASSRKQQVLLPVSRLIVLSLAAVSGAALHSWAVRAACPEEAISEAWRGRPGLHGQTGVMGSAGVKLLVVGKGCGPVVTVGCCRLTCAAESGTGAGAWVPGRAGSWAVCAQSRLENWARWSWGSCSVTNSLPLCTHRKTHRQRQSNVSQQND